MELSAGKYWSLRRLADEKGFFRMTAVDQRPPIRAMVAQRRRVAEPAYEDVGAVKALLIEELGEHSSALLLDPGYAYPYAIDRVDPRKGLLVTLERFESEETPGGRKTFPYPGWSVAKIKRLGADGVKLMLWYRPDASAEVRRHQQALVEQVGRECREHDLAFLIEPLVYPFAGNARDDVEDREKRPELVIESVRELADERYGIDIFKLESPIAAHLVPDPDAGGAAAEEALDWFRRIDALVDRPWVMLSAGAGAEPFRRILGYAFRAGASGYLAGRAIWWQAFQAYPNMDAFRAALRSDGIRYIAEIGRMLERDAMPWWRRPIFRDGIRLAGAGPAFFQQYPEK